MWRTILGVMILALGIPGMPLVSHAQQPKKVYRIGYLTLDYGIDRAFREALAQLGYVEGQNLHIGNTKPFFVWPTPDAEDR